MDGSACLYFVVLDGFVVSHSLATKDQSLLHRRNASLLFNPFFHLADRHVRLHVNVNLFAGKCLDFDDHCASEC